MGVKVSLGADPEAFLYDELAMKIIPACGLIGGTKEKPLYFNKGLMKGFTVQEDNVMVEFNIPPALSAAQFQEYMTTAKDAVASYVRSINPFWHLRYQPKADFTAEELSTPQAAQFGCLADFDAYRDGTEFEKVKPVDLGNTRLAGGHIHVGVQTEVPVWVCAAFADYFIGLDLIGVEPVPNFRRKFYGQPGRYRPKPYGFEYRTPSNSWVGADYGALDVANRGFALGNFLGNAPISLIRKAYQQMPWDVVRRAIIDDDQQLAMMLRDYVTAEVGLGEWQ